jgi:error-prone DNA polymerase
MGNYYMELQHNLVFGDSERNKKLLELSEETSSKLVATGNVHYHIRERHQLQDCLVAVKNCKSLEETHRERRPNSEFYLRPLPELEKLFKEYPRALDNTLEIAGRCTLDLTEDLSYTFPDYAAPDGMTADAYLEKLCYEAAVRRYGSITTEVRNRLTEEFSLIRKYKLAGFLLLYHEVIKLGREVMIEQGLSDPSLTLEENPPGRGRGSSVALLVGYLIGLSHIDPLKYKLSLERFLPDDMMTNVPDIDLDFPRSIREDLILRTHQKWGWDHAVLTGTTKPAPGRSRPALQTLRLRERPSPAVADGEIAALQGQNRLAGVAGSGAPVGGTGRLSQIYGTAPGRNAYFFHSSN